MEEPNHPESAATARSRCVFRGSSLEPRAELAMKPVQLLIKSLNGMSERQGGMPFEAMRLMHESYEKERSKLLQMCHEGREGIIRPAANRWPGKKAASGSEVLPDSELKKHSDGQTTGPVLYADLCFKEKRASRSTCSTAKRDPERSTASSFNLGDLRQPPATEMKLHKLTADIRKKTRVTVSERDRKIAALMLVKHQEKQDRLKLSHLEEEKRQEARRQAEEQQAQTEKERRRKLKKNVKCWHRQLEARRRTREHWEQEKAVELEQEVMLQDNRWRKLKEEVEAQRRGKIEDAQKEAEERKHHQERLLREKVEVEERTREKERQVAVKKEERARRSKMLQEKRAQKRLQEENNRDQLRHILLKKQVQQQIEEEEAQLRCTLERKLQLSTEKRTRAVEAQLRELQERAAQEEEQLQRAQLRAKLQSIQELTHKQILVQLSQRRMEKAALRASALRRSRAQLARQRNRHRQMCHQKLREKIQRQEEATTKVRENHISMKEWKRERLRRQREQIQEEAQKLVQASFHMRDRVRQQTTSRTFDQMALEAQLTASINRIKL